MLRLVIAEDDLLVREGLRGIAGSASDLDVVAVCSGLDELLAAVAEHSPHVVLTDIRMPPTKTDEGIRAAAALRRSHPQTGVVVLSQHDDPEFALALLAEGAQGRAYLLKERMSDPAQLLGAVRAVAAGGSVIDPKIVEGLVRVRRAATPLASLSPRERSVLSEMAAGKDNAGIASTLFLTVRAVEKNINAIFAKLNLTSEPEVHKRVKAVLVYLAENEA
jgi:DNA-binding NarL/FixJ family response regulator